MAAKPLSISVPLPLSTQNANLSPTVYHRSPTSGSPIFDIPEFPALRRVKPLPKRRRVNIDDDDETSPQPRASAVNTKESLSLDTIAPIPLDATPEELIAHAERLKTEMAAQGYEQYLPILGGVQDLFRGVAAAAAAASAAGNATNGPRTRGNRSNIAASVSDLGNKLSLASEALEKALAHAAAAGVGLSSSNGTSLASLEDDDLGESDYLDHLQQPGNTKKRKVPANASGSRGRVHDSGSGQSGGEEESSERDRDSGVGPPTGRSDGLSGSPRSRNTFLSSFRPSRKSRLPTITLAGIQHKKTIANRKKQLADVLVSLSLVDTMSLEQALSNNYPFAAAAASIASATAGKSADSSGPRVRLSKRTAPRLARLGKRALKLRHPDKIGLAVADFTFRYDYATAERLVALKEEVALLKTRFEAELARQTTKAKLAAANRMLASFPTKGSRHKRSGGGTDRAQRQRTIAPSGGGKGADQNAEFLDQALAPPVKVKSSKKKKRSALANASNPHHLRNYVPSRLPHSGIGSHANQAEVNNYLSPLPLRFLSADLPPRRKRSSRISVQPSSNLTNPADEWICAYCEYELFYGDDQDYRRAIRQRKKILRRRRRAQERAAAAASGNSKLKVTPERNRDDGDDEAEFEVPEEDFGGKPLQQPKWKGGDLNKDGAEEASSYG